MSTTVAGDETQFRTFQQYKRYFSPLPEQIEYQEDKKDDPDYAWGVEVANKALDEAKRKMEEEKKKAPWER